MSISSCPQCGKQVTIPAGVGTSAKVRCPLCHSQYSLADALVNMPPLLELIDEAVAGESEPPDDAIAATVALAPESIEPLEAPAEEAAAEPIAEDGPAESLEFELADGEQGEGQAGQDVEFEALGLADGEPAVREVADDVEPLEIDSGAEESELVFDTEADQDETPVATDAPLGDDLELEFEDVTPTAAAEEGEEIQFSDESEAIRFEDESAPADAAPAEATEGDDLVFDLDDEQEEETAEAAGDAGLDDLGEVAFETAESDQSDALDFGEPVEEEAPLAPVAAVAGEEEPEEEADAKKGKKKKKKEKKAKAEGDAKPRRSRSTVLSAALGALIAVPLALYGVLWLGPDYDFLGLGESLHNWGVPVPASYGRRVAAKPPSPSYPAPGGATQSSDATQPPALADDPGSLPTESPTETAADPTTEPTAEPSTEPADDTSPPEMPAEPAAEPPAAPEDPLAAPPDAPPAEPEMSGAEPSTDLPADEPAAAPAEPSEDPLDDLFPSEDTPDAPAESPETPPADSPDAPPAEMPEEPADAALPAEPADPFSETAPEEPAESPSPTPPPADDPFADTAVPTEPNELPVPADEPMPEQPAAEQLGPLGVEPVSMDDLTKAVTNAQVANRQMGAVGPTTPEEEVKKLRSNFYLSFFRLANALTFAADDAASGQLETMRGQLDQYLRRFATDAKRLDALKYNAGRWLAFPRRTTPGIMLAGTVQSAEPVGGLHEIKLGIGLDSDAPIVTVLAADAPDFVTGDQAIVLGSIVDNPADNVAGYQGSEPTAVWNGMAIKLAPQP